MAQKGTMQWRMGLAVFTLTLGLLDLDAKPAAACTLVCGYFLPGDGATIPSNTPALALLHSSPDIGEVRLTRIDGERMEEQTISVEPLDLELEYARDLSLIHPASLVEGGRYRLEAMAQPSGCKSFPVTFEVGPRAKLPEAVGRLVATHSRSEDIGLACPSNPAFWGAHSELYVSIEDEVRPWRALLLYRSFVDDMARSYQSGITNDFNQPQDEVMRACDEHSEEPEREQHEVYFEALLPGVAETLKTSPVSLELRCENRPPRSRTDALSVDAGADDAVKPVARQAAAPAAGGCNVASDPGARTNSPAWGLLSGALVLGLARARKREAR